MRDRVRENTPWKIQRRLDDETAAVVRAYSRRSREEIEQRLRDLDSEWDIERVIQAEAGVTALAGVALGAAVSRKWLVVPGFAAAMLFLHGVQGFYPLLPVFRRMGLRTAQEIEGERAALRQLLADGAGS